MKRATLASLILLAVVAALPAPASAALRSPQVPLSDGGVNLQNQINALNSGAIDVTKEQLDHSRWKKNVSGFATFTLSFELGGNPNQNSIGVYNAVTDAGQVVPESEMFEIFPASAEEKWYAVAQFRSPENTLDVTLFDALHVQQGAPTHYDGVDVNDFGFYIKNGTTIGFGQDLLNPGSQARALVFAGTDDNEGGWFLCFEDGLPSVPPAQALGIVDTDSQDFDEAILFLEAVRPVPVNKATWAALKSRFR